MKKTSMEELGRISPKEFKKSNKAPICLVLDNIRSLQNVGSIFRTADAFRITKIYLCGITGQPPNREIEKTALGATESVEHNYFETTLAAVKALKDENYKIISIEQANTSTSLENFKIDSESKYAFVFGNEVFGVEDEIVRISDEIVEIPQFGTKHSLNVSISAGIVIWDYYSKNNLNLFFNPS
ncbi:RNA methyltransferase [Arcticibacterium luteifluviistationis]|uniref:RNA methyltransferase n=1 Tax=Arcticibacterium luteifluviistationis TaxID=1784714 RepID=A0A2Z4GIS7_9BACT|nr:RNA methyltransferase [Arcticibacterium luteifluviistationis]